MSLGSLLLLITHQPKLNHKLNTQQQNANKNHHEIPPSCNAGGPGSIPGSGRSPGEGIGYPLQYSWASLVAQLVKNLPAVCKIWFDHGLGRFPGEGKGYPLQYSGLYSPRGCKQLDTTERLLEKAMAPHSSTLAWKIPWREEPGRLQSMRSLRVRHD